LRGYAVRDIAHANRLLRRFLRKYNNTPHGSLKYQTPLQVYRYKQTTGDISAVT
jgi:transposase InsO family protein